MWIFTSLTQFFKIQAQLEKKEMEGKKQNRYERNG